MGLFDTVYCEYPLPEPADQALRFQTKEFECLFDTYLITAEGRLIRKARGLGQGLARDVEWPFHGDLRIYASEPDGATETRRWVEYRVRFTHGRVEWIRPFDEVRRNGPLAENEPAAVFGAPESEESADDDCARPASDQSAEATLLAGLRDRSDELGALFEAASDHWGFEDPVYRFYHQSFKVFWLQETTRTIVTTLESLVPGRSLHPWFLEIVEAGTGKTFTLEDNAIWTTATRPILEAFFHARYFLEMAVRYRDLEEPPELLPSGYAALLALYGLR